MTNVTEESARSLKGAFAFEQFSRIFEAECIPSEKLKRKEVLGEGGFAKVYKCSLKSSKKTESFAEKELKPEILNFQSQDVRTFFGEARLLRKLDHPHVVGFKGVVCHNEMEHGQRQLSISLVQEFMNFGSLDDIIKLAMRSSRDVYTRREGLEWMIQVAEGVRHVHCFKHGTILHRDLKPANILLHRDPKTKKITAKIADFGLSALVRKSERVVDKAREDSLKTLKQEGEGRQPATPPVQKNGSNLLTRLSVLSELFQHSSKGDLGAMKERSAKIIMASRKHDLSGRTGSLMYMAPEVLNCEKYNEKVDVFSFAMVLYEVMRRYKNIYAFLHSADNAREAVERYTENVANGFRPPVNHELPNELNDLIEECWAQVPEHRPSMREVAERLTAVYDAGFGLDEARAAQETGASTVGCCSIQ